MSGKPYRATGIKQPIGIFPVKIRPIVSFLRKPSPAGKAGASRLDGRPIYCYSQYP